ncbi:MAG: hypothetical protein Kow0075_01780 [Salibacteraceae bacterium]
MTWAENLLLYYENLKCPALPYGIECMNPYRETAVMDCVRVFLSKYYADDQQRTLLFGINPGRFGSGTTGLSFTDPVALESALGISNSFKKQRELSSEFVYKVIDAMGGPSVFYARFFVSAVYPLGFLKDGKNLNYYEIPGWEKQLKPHIENEIRQHLNWPVNREVAVCIGKGTNAKIFMELNRMNGWFNRIEILPHPRWVMQYNRKRLGDYVAEYCRCLNALSH